MAHLADADGKVAKTMDRVSTYGSVLWWGGCLLLLAGLLVPEFRLALIVASTALLVALSGMLLRNKNGRSSLLASNSVDNLFAFDERAIFVTNGSGEIMTSNTAAHQLLGGVHNGTALERALSDLISNAPAIIFRLQAKALRSDVAKEDVVTRRGRFRLSAHRMAGADSLIWSVIDLADESNSSHGAEKITLPMFTVGSSGAVLFMNDAMRKIVGGRAKSLDTIFVKPVIKSCDRAIISSEAGPLEVLVVMLPGGLGRTEYYLAPSGDAVDAPMGLGELEDFPVALLEMASDGQIRSFNQLACRLLRLDDQQKLSLNDVIEGLGRPVSEWLSDAAEGKGLHRPEILKASSGPDELYVQVTLGRMIQDGEVVLVALISDATELKSLEAQFVQSQKMQAIGQLAGGVAHDFNNLLTAISGHCDLLMLRHDAGDQDFADLEQISQNANRAASLVGQLLAFSRKQNLQLEVLDMRDTLSDLTHLLNRLVGAQISLKFEHDANLMSVRADRRQLEQVLMNLVVNARDALESTGEIRIETRNKNLASALKRDRAVVPAGDYVLVKVSDEGSGISQDKLPKIFEPFFTTKRSKDGTGLGLSTVYGIVKQTGGFIFADSEVGKGSVFSIYFPTHDLPVQKQIEAEAVQELPHDTRSADGVVLLVEDEAPVRAFASRALKHRGFQVIEADCAETALDLLDDGTLEIDIVLTDVIMPGMDGPTWIKKARLKRPELRVVFMSGYADGSTVKEQLSVPNSVFIAKPFSLDELTSTVRRHMLAAA